MKYIILFACVTFFSVAGIAQKLIDDPNAQRRSVSSFHGIQIGNGIDLYLSQGSEEAVAVSASTAEYRDKIITEVKDGMLKIYYDHNMNSGGGNKKLKAYVSCKALDDLHAGGGSDVFVDGKINSTNMNVEVSGGSDFHGAFTSSILKMEASGGSDIFVSGSATTLKIEASGGSDFHGYDLTTDNCNIDASGGSDVEVTANKEMTIDASGGSDIRYKGSGVIRNLTNSGSSGIKKVN